MLSLNFTGELNDKLKGFYRCKYTAEDGNEKFCAVTHFEVLFNIIIPLLRHFTIRAKERTKYATLLHCRTGQKYGLKARQQNG